MKNIKNNSSFNELFLELIDIEKINNNQLLLIKKDKRILITDADNSFEDLCYEFLGKILNLQDSQNKKTKTIKVIWKSWEIDFLKTNYKIKNSFEICDILKKSPYQVNHMMSKLNLFNIQKWSVDELLFLKENIDNSTIWLAQKLCRSVASIKAKKRVLKNIDKTA